MIIDRISLLTLLPQEWGFNSRGLKRICSISSSRTFGIQGENSINSKRNSWSILLQLRHNRVLTPGDHEELKTFLKIRLISLRIDQKLKNKGENTPVLKRILARKFRPFDAVVGAD